MQGVYGVYIMSEEPLIPITQICSEIVRLSSNHVCAMLMMAVWNHKQSVFDTEYLALDCCRCDVPTLKRELADLVRRGMADVTYSATSESPRVNVNVQFRYADWDSLPDFERGAQ